MYVYVTSLLSSNRHSNSERLFARVATRRQSKEKEIPQHFSSYLHQLKSRIPDSLTLLQNRPKRKTTPPPHMAAIDPRHCPF